MNKSMAMCFAFIMVALTLPAIAKPNDVSGWKDLRWGMSDVEVRRLYPSAKYDPTELQTPDGRTVKNCLSFDKLEVLGIPFKVTFVPDKNGNLMEVILACASTTNTADRFTELIKTMTGLYGVPTINSMAASAAMVTASWHFPSSDIEANRIWMGNHPPTIGIRYWKNNTASRSDAAKNL